MRTRDSASAHPAARGLRVQRRGRLLGGAPDLIADLLDPLFSCQLNASRLTAALRPLPLYYSSNLRTSSPTPHGKLVISRQERPHPTLLHSITRHVPWRAPPYSLSLHSIPPFAPPVRPSIAPFSSSTCGAKATRTCLSLFFRSTSALPPHPIPARCLLDIPRTILCFGCMVYLSTVTSAASTFSFLAEYNAIASRPFISIVTPLAF